LPLSLAVIFLLRGREGNGDLGWGGVMGNMREEGGRRGAAVGLFGVR